MNKLQVSRRDENVPEGLEDAILFAKSQLCSPPSESSEVVRLCILSWSLIVKNTCHFLEED